MKKSLLLMALALGSTTMANAQAETQKGDFAVEVGFMPFKDNGETFKLNEGMFKVRYFLSDKDALRVKLGVGIDNSTDTEDRSYDPIDKTNGYTISSSTKETKTKKSQFEFAVGYERHFKTVGRADFYVGAELGYGVVACSAKSEENRVATVYNSGGQVTGSGTQYEMTETFKSNGSDRSSHYFVGAAVAGMDFYVYKSLYLGAELGIKFKSATSPNTYTETTSVEKLYNASGVLTASTEEFTSTETGITTTKTFANSTTHEAMTNVPVVSNESTSTSLKFYVEPSIRLGWTF